MYSLSVLYKYHMGARVVSKIPSAAQGLRAKPEARGLRDGIFDATQGPIWYFYYLIVYFMKNICKSVFCYQLASKNGIKILVLQIRLISLHGQKSRQNNEIIAFIHQLTK